VFAASERQYTATGGEVQVPWSSTIFASDGRRNEEIDKWIGKPNAVLRELYRSVVTKRAFKHRKAVSFQIGLCSDPYFWSWILGNDRRNIISGASGRDGILAKSPRFDTFEIVPGARNKSDTPMLAFKAIWK